MDTLLARLRSLWQGLRRDAGLYEEMDEEFRLHLELRTEDLIRSGLSPAEAARRARLEFGSTERYKEEGRESRGLRLFDELRADLRYTARTLRKSPGFTAVAILTLALGIGANAAVFGVVKSVLLDALPYADADRLVRVYSHWATSPSERQSLSPGVATDFAERLRSVSSVAPFNFSTHDVTYTGEAGPQVLSAVWVGGGLFSTLGVRAVLGRTLTEADAGAPVVMLSDAAWQREFGGDPGVIGRTLRIDQDPYEVVGVLPRGFVGPMGDADLWLPLNLAPMLSDPGSGRDQHWLGIVGRLAPGVGIDAAQREIDQLGAELAREQHRFHHPEDGGVGTDAQCEREDRNGGEAGALAQRACGVTQVGP
ncbi:MAG TPA: ABC transporter permease [Longimicrobiaceae bacterium]|nr:ABC transporter permease [Longimicrobiaceae bacterium]